MPKNMDSMWLTNSDRDLQILINEALSVFVSQICWSGFP